MNTTYGGKYLKIRKAVHEAGFDEFYQAGSVSKFHKMNIVCESAALKKRFWVCIDGGYWAKDELHISTRNLDGGLDNDRVYFNSEEEMAAAIKRIGGQIRQAKAINEKEEAE
jgi:hypothetical protein